MPQSLLKTPPDAGQALQVGGRTLVSAHEQITGILRSRLGQNHGDLLAIPRVDADGGVRWTTNVTGPVLAADQLPDDERAKLQQRAERFSAEVRGLAQQLRGEGPAAQLVAQMLEQAPQTPPGSWLFSVGGKPVLAMWGHAAPGAVLPPTVPAAAVAAPVAVADTAVAQAAPPVVPPSPTVPTPPGGGGKPWKRWLLWGLLALLLLALLLWGLKRCSEAPTNDADLAEQIAQAEARNRALEEDIARRRGNPALQCVPDGAPPPAASAPDVPDAQPLPPVSPTPAASAPELPASQPVPPRAAPSAPAPAHEPSPAASAPTPAPKPAASAPDAPRAPAPSASQAAAPRSDGSARQACKPRRPGDEPEVVVIFDASDSMRNPIAGGTSRLDAAKRSVEEMVRGLPPDVDVGLVEFSACGQVRRDKFYPSAQRGALIGEIGGLAPKQGTPLADALRRAGAVASDSAQSTIVIVSDGGDSCGGDPCAVARSIRTAKPNVSINVIDMSETARDRQVLQCIAQAGGGRVLSAGDAADMTRKMREAAGAANCP